MPDSSVSLLNGDRCRFKKIYDDCCCTCPPSLFFFATIFLTAFSKVHSTIQKCFGKDQSSITFASPLTVCFLYKCLGRKKNKWEDYYSSSFKVTMLMFCFSAALPQKKSKKKGCKCTRTQSSSGATRTSLLQTS